MKPPKPHIANENRVGFQRTRRIKKTLKNEERTSDAMIVVTVLKLRKVPDISAEKVGFDIVITHTKTNNINSISAQSNDFLMSLDRVNSKWSNDGSVTARR